MPERLLPVPPPASFETPSIKGKPRMQLAPHLFFDGTCEEALAFYADVLGGKVTEINRYADSPVSEQMPPEFRDRIMHAVVIASGITIVASDASDARGEMHRVSLSLVVAGSDEAARVFARLAGGGSIVLPFARRAWASWFGMLVDRYGVRWMIAAS